MQSTEPAAYCLGRAGRSRAGWDALVVGGTADTALSATDLWGVWSDLEHWPLWSPLHQSVTRTGEPSALAPGATFDQRLNLGFPFRTTTQHVTIADLEPARRAAWAGSGNGVRSCHRWSFTPLPDGTRVSNTEAFAGLPAAILRPLVAGRWNRAFQDAVEGLIDRAGGVTMPAPGSNPKEVPQ